MNQINNSPICERGSDLISFLYGEANEPELRDFEIHLQQCRNCQAEVASFGDVRESIGAWRDEALTGFVSSPVTTRARKKSAIAALREFFDLSPLWMKGAVAFATVSFCLLAVLATARLQTTESRVSSANRKSDAVYSEQDLNRIVNEALAKQRLSLEPAQENAETVVANETPQRKASSRRAGSTQVAKGRPLSRAEREQLAADLRLLSTHDDEVLDLLGDRINQ